MGEGRRNLRRQFLVAPLSVELIAQSWGGGRQALTGLQMVGGVLVGEGGSVGGLTPSALYTVSWAPGRWPSGCSIRLTSSGFR